MLLYVHRDEGRGAQDGHLDFHTSPELRDSSLFLLYVHRDLKDY